MPERRPVHVHTGPKSLGSLTHVVEELRLDRRDALFGGTVNRFYNRRKVAGNHVLEIDSDWEERHNRIVLYDLTSSGGIARNVNFRSWHGFHFAQQRAF